MFPRKPSLGFSRKLILAVQKHRKNQVGQSVWRGGLRRGTGQLQPRRELNNLHLLLLIAKNPCREFGKGL